MDEGAIERAAMAGYVANYKVYGIPGERIVHWEDAEPATRQNWRFLAGQMAAALGFVPQPEPVNPGSASNTGDPNNSSRSITGTGETGNERAG